jgi:hypothetical protein
LPQLAVAQLCEQTLPISASAEYGEAVDKIAVKMLPGVLGAMTPDIIMGPVFP